LKTTTQAALTRNTLTSYEYFLAMLHAAPTVEHMDIPGFRLHRLKGKLKGFWAVTVRANWRVIFRFNGDAEDV